MSDVRPLSVQQRTSLDLSAQALGRRTEDYAEQRVPRLVLARGHTFGYAGRPVFSRLIDPAPRIAGGLGTHVTLDLAGRNAGL